jgi:bifunctional UDP-N-acetylglucosamine pyrophosphorylase/glucosamine-1-phosphate N-acetyltransferase
MNKKVRALIMAAGKSKRMKSEKSKVLHEILGKTLVEYVVDALEFEPIERIGVVVSEHNREEVETVFGTRVDYILQKEQLGSAHAVMVAEKWLEGFTGSLVVVVGDGPFINIPIMQILIQHQQKSGVAAAFLSGIYDSPPPYGRVVRDTRNRVLRIVEEKDASPEERKIKEVSSSHYCFDVEKLFPALGKTNRENAQNEYYLPDVIGILTASGETVDAIPVDDPFLTFGINTREDFVASAEELERRIIKKWLQNGVTVMDPSKTYIDATVEIGKDTVILPFTYLGGKTHIGTKCTIGPFVQIQDSVIANNSGLNWIRIINGKRI